MKLKDLFEKNKVVFSCEVFPPKKPGTIEDIYGTLEGLAQIKPDFISVTYGAGGNTADTMTCDVASLIKNRYGIESAAHLTCVNCTRQDVDVILTRLQENNIENILALRGDINPKFEPKHDFKYASELVEFIKEHGDYGISGACYPEGHMESDNIVEDILNLKKKVDAGAQHLISQLFFDNRLFYDFVEKTKLAGISVPIEAGIMPVTDIKQINRMVSMCGASVPSELAKVMNHYQNDPEGMREAGIQYAINQIIDLINHGADGIHLYTMNNPKVACRIYNEIKSYLGR